MNAKAKRAIGLVCCAAVAFGGCNGTPETEVNEITTSETTTVVKAVTEAVTTEKNSSGIVRLSEIYAEQGDEYYGSFYCRSSNTYVRPCDYTYDEEQGVMSRINNPKMLTHPGFLYINDEETPDTFYDDYAFVYGYLDDYNPYNFYVVPQKIYCTEVDLSDYRWELVEPTVENAYCRSDNVIVVNAFMNRQGGELHFYIDPAYIKGLPCINGNIQPLISCSINGVDVVMSTLEFTGDVLSKDAAKALAEVGEEYVYAKLTLGIMGVREDDSNITTVIAAEIIEQDASAALDKVYLDWEIATEKDEEKEKLYKLLVETADEWTTSELVGLNLVDLDNNGTPEVLFSYQFTPTDMYDTGCDITTRVNVFEDGQLKQVSELNAYRDYRNTLPEIKSRTLEDGTVEWLYNSSVNYETGERQNMTYTIQLVNDELELTEIFRVENEAYDDVKHEMYYMGERFAAGTMLFEEVFEHYKDVYSLEYSPSMAYSVGYCSDIDGIPALGDLAREYYSEQFDDDCCSLVGEMFYYNGRVFELYPIVTERMLSYEIAAQLDAAYKAAR